MDYYQELGIHRSATLGEIHRAHCRLSKLLHPDLQTDDAMKVLAETQMRRLNAIIGILSNPELRHQYDNQLKGTLLPPTAANAVRTRPRDELSLRLGWRARRRFLQWWLWTPLGAVVLTMSVVWFWADHLGSSSNSQTPAYVRPSVREEAAPKNRPAHSTGFASEPENDVSAASAPSQVRHPVQLPALDERAGKDSSAGIEQRAAKRGSNNSPLKHDGDRLPGAGGGRLANPSRRYGAKPLEAANSNDLANAKVAAPQAKQGGERKAENTERDQPGPFIARADATPAMAVETVQMRTNAVNLPSPPKLAVADPQQSIPAPLLSLPQMPIGVLRARP